MSALTESRRRAMGLADERLHDQPKSLELTAKDLELEDIAGPATAKAAPALPDFQSQARKAHAPRGQADHRRP